MSNFGPWFVASLYSNETQQIIVHTFAEHFDFVYAVLEPAKKWRLRELLGPFEKKSEAEKIGQIWQGRDFGKKVAEQFNVNYWKMDRVISIPKDVGEPLTLKRIKELKKS